MSFYPRAPFRKEWKWVLPAIGGVSLVFVLIRAQFAATGVISFNPDRILGSYLGSIPVEELLYCFFASYCWMFIYFFTRYYVPGKQMKYSSRIFSGLAGIFCLVMFVMHYDQWYTVICFLAGTILLSSLFLQKPYWLGHFMISYSASLVPFITVSALIHGAGLETTTINYNIIERLGDTFISIPAEDFVYLFVVQGCTIALYEYIRRK